MDETSYSARLNGAVQLSEVAPILAKSHVVQTNLMQRFGVAKSWEVLQQLATGQLTGELGGDLHDFLADIIVNDAILAWQGYTIDPSDPSNDESHFPVNVMEYEGVYFVSALEFDKIGYFKSLQDAKSYASLEHENLEEFIPLGGDDSQINVPPA
jgi:hypothetical protein